MRVRALLLFLFAGSVLLGDPAPSLPPETILDHYCAASQGQSDALRGASMDMEVQASLPKLKKSGRLSALRRISAIGRITYEALKFDGDSTVNKYVIKNYLTAEAETVKEQSPSVAVTPENYKFKYRGRVTLDDRDLHVFQVTPKKKRSGLYKGDIWIDAVTYLRVREAGVLVKNPSIVIKRVEFVRRYEIKDGLCVPLDVQSTVSTRLVGKAELTIAYSNWSLDSGTQAVAAAAGGQ